MGSSLALKHIFNFYRRTYPARLSQLESLQDLSWGTAQPVQQQPLPQHPSLIWMKLSAPQHLLCLKSSPPFTSTVAQQWMATNAAFLCCSGPPLAHLVLAMLSPNPYSFFFLPVFNIGVFMVLLTGDPLPCQRKAGIPAQRTSLNSVLFELLVKSCKSSCMLCGIFPLCEAWEAGFPWDVRVLGYLDKGFKQAGRHAGLRGLATGESRQWPSIMQTSVFLWTNQTGLNAKLEKAISLPLGPPSKRPNPVDEEDSVEIAIWPKTFPSTSPQYLPHKEIRIWIKSVRERSAEIGIWLGCFAVAN